MEQDLYDLPVGWEWKELFSVTDKTDNLNPTKHEDKNWTYIDISSIDRNIFCITTPKIILGKDAPSRAKKHVQNNDILFATTRPNLKNITIIDSEYDSPIASTGFCILRSKECLLPKYLFYFAISDIMQLQIEPFIGGASYPAITDSNLKKTKIPIPPLLEQQRIVTKLDALLSRIDKAIDLLRQCLILINQTYNSALEETFNPLNSQQNSHDGKYDLPDGWEWMKVESLCHKITDGTHNTPEYTKVGIPFLSVKDISKGFIDFSNTRFVSPHTHEKLYKRCNPEFNDILYTKVGTTGIAKVIDTQQDFSLFVSVALLKSKKDIYPLFFEYVLNSPYAYKQSQQRTRGGANKNLVLKDIKEITLPIPSLPIQELIIIKIKHLKSLYQQSKDNMTTQIKQLEQLKASILDAAFKGAL